ncbi:hypothetical protein [Marinobacterium rhizophilum]|uniref:Uncharacterized protein n=1 Tax=Marinobacterium rhizophilum TaxID=420402 RepID=A0ABY5HKH6_9GAMM|nr:hypothetical protein [Marinobacterium rhizophilum]UTW12624.1 hypothetical protein KDW95_02760 [Marinobacterium rhizophilum]
MFEAHFSAAPETASPHWAAAGYASHRSEPAPGIRTQQGLTRRLQSLRHACPLHAWAAPGKRKDACGTVRQHWFLYIEYCILGGARAWHKIECSQADCSLDELFGQALWAQLPGLDRDQTRRWLDDDRSS